jgi:hypothetical protein
MNIDWSTVDWSKGTYRLANELGVAPCTVSAHRRKLAPETMRRSMPTRGVDWTAAASELAATYGFSVNTVYRVRKLTSPTLGRVFAIKRSLTRIEASIERLKARRDALVAELHNSQLA